MFSKSNLPFSILSVFLFCVVVLCMTIDLSARINAQPTAGIGNIFGSATNKIEDTDTERKVDVVKTDPAEQSFKAFINSKPSDSTVIGEINPNASELEKTILRAKIKNAIEVMKSEKTKSIDDKTGAGSQAECYIEVTRVEKVAGKCHRTSSGLPICQAENYMTISNECK